MVIFSNNFRVKVTKVAPRKTSDACVAMARMVTRHGKNHAAGHSRALGLGLGLIAPKTKVRFALSVFPVVQFLKVWDEFHRII